MFLGYTIQVTLIGDLMAMLVARLGCCRRGVGYTCILRHMVCYLDNHVSILIPKKVFGILSRMLGGRWQDSSLHKRVEWNAFAAKARDRYSQTQVIDAWLQLAVETIVEQVYQAMQCL